MTKRKISLLVTGTYFLGVLVGIYTGWFLFNPTPTKPTKVTIVLVDKAYYEEKSKTLLQLEDGSRVWVHGMWGSTYTFEDDKSSFMVDSAWLQEHKLREDKY